MGETGIAVLRVELQVAAEDLQQAIVEYQEIPTWNLRRLRRVRRRYYRALNELERLHGAAAGR